MMPIHFYAVYNHAGIIRPRKMPFPPFLLHVNDVTFELTWGEIMHFHRARREAQFLIADNAKRRDGPTRILAIPQRRI